MSSLTSSLRLHCAGPSPSWRRGALSSGSALPASSTFATPGTISSTHDSLRSAPEAQVTKAVDRLGCDDSPQASILHGHQQSALQSVLSLVVAFAMAIGVQGAPPSRDTFEDVPQTLSGGDKGQRIQKPKSAKAESCTRKCVSTCVRGGAGSGEGPLNVRRPLVVFKEGFRSRQYWYEASLDFNSNVFSIVL